MIQAIKRMFSDTRGTTAVEYGLICALIGIVIISALQVLGPTIEAVFLAIEASMAAPAP